MTATLPRRVHVLGIGGIGMSAVALLLRQRGVEVSGSDLRESPVVQRVRAAGCLVALRPEPHWAASADWWVAPDGVAADHPERLAARKAGVELLDRTEALERVLGATPRVGVAGTLARSAGALLLAEALGGAAAGVGLVAGALPADGSAHARDGRPVVLEVDERRPGRGASLGVVVSDLQRPAFGYYPDDGDPLAALRALTVPLLLPWRDGPKTWRWAADEGAEGVTIEVSEPRAARWRVLVRASHGTVELETAPYALALAAAGAAMAASTTWLGVPLERAAARLHAAVGVSAQLSVVRAGGFGLVVHDVRTHAVAVRALCGAVSDRAGQAAIVVLRPYAPTLDAVGPDRYAEACAAADTVLLLPAYPGAATDARETLAKALTARGVGCTSVSDDGVVEVLQNASRPVLFLGGDDIAALAARFVSV